MPDPASEAADLLALVRRGGAADRGRLRDLDGQWRVVERTIAEEFSVAPKSAARLVDAYERLADASGEPEATGRAARLRGSCLAYFGRYAASIPHYERAARILTGAAADGARLGLAASMARSSRFDDAARLCRRVRAAASRRGDSLVAAGADLAGATALHDAGRVAAAVALYVRARAAFTAAGDAAHAAVAAQNLANASVLLDRHDEALALLDEAAAEFAGIGAAHEAARVRYNRGALLVALDRLGDAERELAAVERDLSRAGDAQLAALARLDRGEALLRAGLAAEAARLLDSAARGLAKGAPPPETMRACLLRARAAVVRGESASARRILARAKSPATRSWEADRVELLGLALAGERRFDDARRALERSAAGFGASRPSARSRAVCAAGWCAFEAGDLPAARRLARKADRAASRLAIPSLAFGAASLLFTVEDAAGRRGAASAALKRALAALERTREGLGSDPMRAAALRGRERWFARAVRHLLAGPSGEERALALVERWRSRALVELMASCAKVDDDGGRLAALRARVAVLERRLEGGALPSFLRAPAVTGAPRIVRRLAAAERRLFEEMSLRLRACADPAFSLERLRKSLPATTALVSLFADERGGVAFVVRRDRVDAVALDLADVELRSLVEELYFRVGQFGLGPEFVERRRRRLAVETDRILAAAADRTLDPIAEHLEGADRVVIAPHDAWRQVPFAALPLRGGRLMESVAVAMSPSLSALSADVAAARGRPLVLAVPDARAPTITREGRDVAASAGDCAYLEGEAATLAALRVAQPPRFVHVAAHGRFRADAAAMAGVRLADGWLRAVDFHTLDLTGSLVVLSGCETGVSSVDPGGEVQGLVRAVLSSGAAELVVSLWRVDDAATARLMARFHELRTGAVSTEAALAAAQREAAAQGLHPWYWAGFNVWTRRLR